MRYFDQQLEKLYLKKLFHLWNQELDHNKLSSQRVMDITIPNHPLARNNLLNLRFDKVRKYKAHFELLVLH